MLLSNVKWGILLRCYKLSLLELMFKIQSNVTPYLEQTDELAVTLCVALSSFENDEISIAFRGTTFCNNIARKRKVLNNSAS